MIHSAIGILRLAVLAGFALISPALGAVVNATFDSAATVPVTASSYTATGNSVNFSLNFVPSVGSNLTVVKNTGLGFIGGRFSNLAQGQVVSLSYNGAAFRFAANYYGGTGNDLVLHWAEPKAYGWGNNALGQVGAGNTSVLRVPTAVVNTGVLAGKTIVSVSAGNYFTLALCADGTVAAWGRNNYGQLGNSSTTNSSVPVNITSSGVLAGKTVIAVSAGYEHSLALCADGTVAAWGSNGNGRLGNSTNTDSSVPVAVTTSGVLAGRTVIAISAGTAFSLALCADGKPVSWGSSGNGQLGNNALGTETNSPVNVTTTGVLAGKLVAAITTGNTHAMALCTDGTLVAWGSNNYGESGGNSGTYISVPVLVSPLGVLAGKSVTAISAGYQHNLALCADGTLAAWGYGSNGALGTGSYLNNATPGAVTTSGVLAGKTVTAIAAGYTHSAALCTDGTLAVWGDNSAYQFGDLSNASYGNVPVAVLATPFGQAKPVLLAAGRAAYHTFALAAVPALSSDSSLAALTVDSGNLSPAFSPGTTNYSVCVANATTTLTVTPTVTNAAATLTVNGTALASGTASPALALAPGINAVSVVVKAADGSTTTYALSVLRPAPLTANFTAASVVPVSFPAYDASGLSASIALGFIPPNGTNLTLVNNTGLRFIQGQFTNLAQGAAVTLSYGGYSYSFVADYFGGNGNDLVLRWANRKTYAAGSNATGQLGNNAVTDANLPVAVTATGALAGKLVTAVAAGQSHTLALCSDGTVAAWGDNSSGELGNGSGGPNALSKVPLAVDATGALAGKVVAAIAAAAKTSYALCADGSVVAWGDNSYGQLGNGSISYGTYSKVPVAVVNGGVLASRPVVAIAAGSSFCLALCADGKVAAWGQNAAGVLGNNGGADSGVPVAVSTAGKLAGKTVTAISAGSNFALVLCADGSMASWGVNWFGQLGDNSTTNSAVPTAVNLSSALVGKTVTAITAGGAHSLALCSDGSLVAWGSNDFGVFGDNTSTSSSLPVAVPAFGALVGRTITAITAGSSHSLALCTDGTVAAWGGNHYGQLGSGDTSGSTVPLAMSRSTLSPGERFTTLAPGSTANHTVALAAVPAASSLTGLTALSLSAGSLSPAFSPAIAAYTASVPNAVTSITVTPIALNADVRLTVNGAAVVTGTATSPIALAEGANTLTIVATSPDGGTVKTHTVIVTRGITLNATFASAATVPVTATRYTAAASVINLALGYAPAPGTTLTVINNTGAAFIAGQFSNLAQFQVVSLTYGNVTYKFVANYYGGSGNDLVLQWANDRIYTWGNNFRGQLGNNSTTNSKVPVAIGGSPLAGKVIVRLAGGTSHCLALCADGSLAAWGDNSSGQLGNNSNTDSSIPVSVTTDGALAGKTVISIAAGESHSLALCADGSLFAWGSNSSGQIGNAGDAYTNCLVPVAVATNGALAGKTVTAIAVGSAHNLALCSDGSVVAWGVANNGQLGNGGTVDRNTPFAVSTSGVLAGKTVTSIAAGVAHSLALCADGTLATWGYNINGQLGNNSSTNTTVPVAINGFGVLSGKTVVAIGAGGYHGLALRSDGVLAAWGYNNYGQLGINSTTDSPVPVAVTASGVLAGKTIRSLAAGDSHCLVHCTDGSLIGWGRNYEGQLGNNTITNSSLPVAAVTSSLASGEKFMALALASTGAHSMAVVAVPLPTSTSLAASAVTGTTATLKGRINAANNAVTVVFEYGLDSTYGSSLAGSPAAVSGATDTAVTAAISGLMPGTVYHYRVVASATGGTVRSADMVFTTLSDNAKLAGLAVNSTALVPGFAKLTTGYMATVPFATTGVTATPATDQPGATVKINGVTVASGSASGAINLVVGNNTLTTRVTAEDGITTKTYIITVTRLPQQFAFNAATDVPVTANGFTAGGYPVNIILNYAPLPGTVLTMVSNTGLGFTDGTFANLAQGQRITLTFNGTPYDFVANYYGGSGNDLMLQWANTQLAGWGANNYGQLGDATTTRRLRPNAVDASGVLAGKTITAVAEGYLHSLALCSDGTLAAWGYNVYGQLGNRSAAPSSVPVAVDSSGVLAGKTVIAISAGPFHNLALCSDGTLAAWGYNNYGQLGTGDTLTSTVPVLVTPGTALLGKQVVAVAAGAYHSFALCADGSVAGWGFNDDGELGNGNTSGSLVPLPVLASGALAGKQIAALAAGQYHTLALCSDGTLVAWGYNNHGQLGNNSTLFSTKPVAIGGLGALAGKTPAIIRAGDAHSLALCTDGSLATWGWNSHGQLGAAAVPQSTIPLAVAMSDLITGTSLLQIAAGRDHCLALCANGKLLTWGDNASGQLGNNSLTPSTAPVSVDVSELPADASCMLLASGSAALHNLAVFGLPSSAVTPHVASLQSLAASAAAPAAAAALLAHAFGLDAPAGGVLPQAKRSGDNYVIEFAEPAGVTGITYGAECSATLLPGSWAELPDTGTGAGHIFSLPVAAGKMFLRLRVTSSRSAP